MWIWKGHTNAQVHYFRFNFFLEICELYKYFSRLLNESVLIVINSWPVSTKKQFASIRLVVLNGKCTFSISTKDRKEPHLEGNHRIKFVFHRQDLVKTGLIFFGRKFIQVAKYVWEGITGGWYKYNPIYFQDFNLLCMIVSLGITLSWTLNTQAIKFWMHFLLYWYYKWLTMV